MAGCIVAGTLIGPSSVFNVDYENYWVTIIGAVLLGIFLGIIYVTCVPEMLERMQVDYHISVNNEVLYGKLSDKVNDLFGFTEAIANFLSPIIGSAIYEHFPKEKAMSYAYDIAGLICLVFTIIIIIFNCGIYFVKENKEFLKQLARYQKPENLRASGSFRGSFIRLSFVQEEQFGEEYDKMVR